MKRILKKTLRITGITLIVLIALALLLPIVFKKQITNLVKQEINKNLAAKVDFRDVSLSLFRHFPKISISIAGLSVAGTETFAGDTLISAKSVDVSANLFSVIKGSNIKVYGLYLESPRIHALVNKEGKANWDITRPGSDTSGGSDTSAPAFKMHLQHYAISNGYILYKDEQGDMTMEISGLDHEGSGDLTADVYTLATKTTAASASFQYASVPYLSHTRTAIETDIQVDYPSGKYSFRTKDVELNNLKLTAEGFFQLANDSTYNMDVKFSTPSNEFRDILSLVPAIYRQDFDKLKTSGHASFNGFVKGTYSPSQLPAYDVNMEVKDGFFQYPDLPKPVRNIQLALHAGNADGKADNAVLDISKGHIEMDQEPFDFKILFKNPVTARYLDAFAKGKLDLSDVSKFVKLEGGTQLAGQVAADVFAKGNLSAIQGLSGNFNAGGFLDIRQLFYSSNALPQPVRNGNFKMQLENSGGAADNTTVNISTGHMEVGNDPVDFSLTLRHPVTSVDFAGMAKGRFTLDNIKQFVQLDPGTVISGIVSGDLAFSGNKTAIDKKEYDKIVCTGTAGLDNFRYVSKDYPGGINLSTAKLALDTKKVSLTDLAGSYLETHFNANGVFDNLVGYAMQDQALTGVLNVTADQMNLNDWMGVAADSTKNAAAGSSAAAAAEPFIVPANIHITINAKGGKVKYDKVDYNNLAGTLVVADQTVKLQNVKAGALDGTMIFNGSYSTKLSKKDPAIDISYDVKDLDIQKTFFAFNTVQKLMPIGQFLAGKLNSQLSMSGHLDGHMMPDITSLTGKGNLLLVEGVLKKFAPLEKIASTLQIDDLKSVTIRDIKNYIEFANGKVLVKPFTVKVKDIEMQIGGMHGIDQSIDYAVQMKVPRKYLGAQGNSLLDHLAAEASGKGIPVKLGDVVDLNIQMGGTMTSPSIHTDLKEVAGDAVKEMQQQAVEFAKAKADTIRQMVKDSLKAVKNEVIKDLKEEAKNQLFGNRDSATANNPDSTKKKAGQTLKNTLNNLFNKKKKQPADSTGK